MLTIEPRRSALILIDLQKGIVGRPVAPHASADVVARGAALAKAFKAAGGVVVYVHVDFGADGAAALKAPVDEPMALPPGGLAKDWAEFAPELAKTTPDVIIVKRHWGAFDGTDLDLQLRRRGVETVVIGGIATNFGVESTAREARQLNYAVVVAEDATASVAADMHAFAIERILPRIARIRSTEAIVAALAV